MLDFLHQIRRSYLMSKHGKPVFKTVRDAIKLKYPNLYVIESSNEELYIRNIDDKLYYINGSLDLCADGTPCYSVTYNADNRANKGFSTNDKVKYLDFVLKLLEEAHKSNEK